jgi:hypothetical protein
MILDPIKMGASLFVSAMIFVFGGLYLGSMSPQMNVAESADFVASNNSFEQTPSETYSTEVSAADENYQSDVQTSPENAIISVEEMLASLEEFSPNNNSDWSLENISDDALEMRR